MKLCVIDESLDTGSPYQYVSVSLHGFCSYLPVTTYSYDKPSYGLSDIKLAIHWVNCSCSTNMLRFILVVQLLANRSVGGTAASGLQYGFASFQLSHTVGYNPFTHRQLRVRRDSNLQVSGVRMSSTGYISRPQSLLNVR